MTDKKNSVSKLKFRIKLQKYLKQFTENTGIHGLKYFTEDRSAVEKWFWLFVLLTSLSGCIFMILQIVENYKQTPVVVSFDNKETKMFEIPFPAVTICPESKTAAYLFNYTEVYELIQNGSSLSAQKRKLFEYVSLLCKNLGDPVFQNAYERNVSIPVCEDFFEITNKYRAEDGYVGEFMDMAYDSVSQYFINIFTDQGICITFNIFDRNHIYKDHVVHYKNFHLLQNVTSTYDVDWGYPEKSSYRVYPFRALVSTVEKSLTIVFYHNTSDTDFLCSQFRLGFRVLLHDPRDIPRLSKSYFGVPLNKAVTAAVKPDLTYITKSVQKFDPSKRNCFLNNERYLQHFKIYTQSNCQLECLTNYTLQLCDCVEFYMPRSNNTRICGAVDQICIESNKLREKNQDFGNHSNCDCKPSCNSLRYNVELSFTEFSWKQFMRQQANIFNASYIEYDFSTLLIYLKDDQFTATVKNELYGTSSLISNFGGLLGLFTGFSIISLVEIFYFSTFRMLYNLRLYGKWWKDQ